MFSGTRSGNRQQNINATKVKAKQSNVITNNTIPHLLSIWPSRATPSHSNLLHNNPINVTLSDNSVIRWL